MSAALVALVRVLTDAVVAGGVVALLVVGTNVEGGADCVDEGGAVLESGGHGVAVAVPVVLVASGVHTQKQSSCPGVLSTSERGATWPG